MVHITSSVDDTMFKKDGYSYPKNNYEIFYEEPSGLDPDSNSLLRIGIRDKFSKEIFISPLPISEYTSDGINPIADYDTLMQLFATHLGFSTAGSAALQTAQDAATAASAADVKALAAQTGYSHTGAFAGKPLSNNYVWEAGTGINYTAQDVSNGTWKVLSLSKAVHDAVDNPYWTTPTPTGNVGVGLFQGANLPNGVFTLVDYEYSYDLQYPSSTGTGYEGSTGRIRLNDCVYGDQLRVRFDFQIIPQIANTTVEAAIWYSNRDDSNNITFTFPLTAQPIFYGGGTVANTYLNRVEISAWITSNEDVNALALPAIKADNPIIVRPLGILITILR